MRSSAAALAVAALLGASACASDAGDEPTLEPAPTDGALEPGPVEVSLGEWAILPSPDEVVAGETTFEVSNGGTDPHELVVVRSERGPADLSTKADGSVDEERVDIIGRSDELPAARGDAVVSDELTVDLDAGRYVLVCNLVEEEDGETQVHYKLGMRAALTVT